MASVRERDGRSVDELLAAVQLLEPTQLSEFQRRLAAWRRKNGPQGPPASAAADEEALLARIEENSALPPGQQRRFERLRRKHQAESLTKSEEKVLQALWRQVEEMNVNRLEALTELARRRGTSVKTLAGQLRLPKNLHVF